MFPDLFLSFFYFYYNQLNIRIDVPFKELTSYSLRAGFLLFLLFNLSDRYIVVT